MGIDNKGILMEENKFLWQEYAKIVEIKDSKVEELAYIIQSQALKEKNLKIRYKKLQRAKRLLKIAEIIRREKNEQ